jgi:hypothetical protein
MANIAYTHGRTDITPATIIGNKGDFVSDRNIARLGSILWGNVAGRIGLSSAANRVREQVLTRAKYDRLNGGNTRRFIGLEVRFNDNPRDIHWVGLVEPTTASDGTPCYIISPTSNSDTDPGNVRFRLEGGWKWENNQALIPIGNRILGYVVFNVP